MIREVSSRHINIGWWQNLTFRGRCRSFLGNKSNKSQLFSILISSARHGRSPFLGHKSLARAFTTSIIHRKAFCATGGAPQVIISQTQHWPHLHHPRVIFNLYQSCRIIKAQQAECQRLKRTRGEQTAAHQIIWQERVCNFSLTKTDFSEIHTLQE